MRRFILGAAVTVALAATAVGGPALAHDPDVDPDAVLAGLCPDGMALTHDTTFYAGPPGAEIKLGEIDVDNNGDDHACFRETISKLLDPQVVDNNVPIREIVKKPPIEK